MSAAAGMRTKECPPLRRALRMRLNHGPRFGRKTKKGRAFRRHLPVGAAQSRGKDSMRPGHERCPELSVVFYRRLIWRSGRGPAAGTAGERSCPERRGLSAIWLVLVSADEYVQAWAVTGV